MLTVVETATDTWKLALFYKTLTSPLVWDDITAITFDNGTCTLTNGGQGYTFDYTSLFYKDTDGDYVYADTNGIYMLSDTDIIGWKRPTSASLIEVKGAGDTYTTETIIQGSLTTIGTPVVSKVDSEEYEGLSTLSSVAVTVDGSSVAFANMIAPKSIVISSDLPGIIDRVVTSSAGWFNFRRREFKIRYQTDGIILPGPRISEVLGIQTKGVVGFEFDRRTQKLILYKTASSQCSETNMDLTLLCMLE